MIVSMFRTAGGRLLTLNTADKAGGSYFNERSPAQLKEDYKTLNSKSCNCSHWI